MNKAQRLEVVKIELDKARKVATEIVLPYIEQRNAILSEYWDEGYTPAEIAKETGYLESSVKRFLTEIGIDWRASLIGVKTEAEEIPFKAYL